MTSDASDTEKCMTYAPCIYNHALLGVVASPRLETVGTVARVFLDTLMGLVPLVEVDMRTLPVPLNEMHDLLRWLDDYVQANEDHLDPSNDTWIGAHSMVGRLFDGLITVGVEEWPFEGKYAISFFLKKSEISNPDFHKRAMLKAMVFHAALSELECIDQERDFIAFGEELDRAFSNLSSHRDALTGKPRLVVVSKDHPTCSNG